MNILKQIAVAFSMYSRIPMPHFSWGSDDMKYHLIFFPWVGFVIGVLQYLWLRFCNGFSVSHIAFTLIVAAIPLIITGGFHLDGYMDVSDALSSYQNREKRLEILKDPHIGAFAVIRLCIYGLLLIACIYSMNEVAFLSWIFIFFISRAVSGICVIRYKKAKSDGSLKTEADTAADRTVVIFLALQIIIAVLIAGYLYQYYFTMCLMGLLLSLIYFRHVSYSMFGGITGDLAGWFVCNSELMAAIFVSIFTIIAGVK